MSNLFKAARSWSGRIRRRVRIQEHLEPRVLLAGDLVARWIASSVEVVDGEPATAWVDSVAGKIGTASGSPIWNGDALDGLSSVEFDGSDDVDSFKIARSDSPVANAGDFTVAVVFATQTTNSSANDGQWYQHMGLVDSSVGGFSTDWGIAMNQAGQIVAGLGGGFGAPSTSIYSHEQALHDGALHVAIFTRTGSNISLYVDNGTPATSTSASAAARDGNLDLYFGKIASGGAPYTGELAEVRFYDGHLNAAEAAALHGEIVEFYQNERPHAEDDSFTATEDALLLVSAANGLLRNDSDPDLDPLTATVIETTKHGTLSVNPDGSFAYKPDQDFFGVDTFTYAAKDVRIGNIATASINVASVNDKPVATPDLYFGPANATLSRSAAEGVLQNDVDVDSPTLTAQLVADATHGSVILHPDGSFDYTPNAQYKGSDTFSYQASDASSQSDVVEVQLFIGDSPVRISEFLTANGTSLTTRTRESATRGFTGEASREDWLELQNMLDVPLSIGGFHLTDDPDTLTKWRIPDGTTIPAAGHLTIFASRLNITDPALDERGLLHTNFTLSVKGEYLAVTAPDGKPLHAYDDYPQQLPDVTYGMQPDGTAGFLLNATPGTTNSEKFTGVVQQPTFSVERGFYSAPFAVTIDAATQGAVIRYTTDGSAPTATNGLVYSSPVNITTTTNLRAAAFKEGYAPSFVTTHTYIFLADVVNQGNSPPGYPTQFGTGEPNTGAWAPRPADYEMDPEITQNPKYKDLMDDALLAVPSISITTSIANLFDPEIGIYQNTDNHGVEWERPASIEMLLPDGTPAFQIDAGIRMQGGASREPWKNPKHGFRLKFKDIYGSGDLQYDWFGGDAVDEFDEIVLRAGANQAWLHHNNFLGDNRGRAQYIRDQWVNDTYRAMGNPAPHNAYAHLYVNGLYWGLYHPKERPEASFMASYFGGSSLDYDVLNAGVVLDGDNEGWRELTNRRFRNLSDDALYEEFSQLLDVDAYLDYIIMNHYGGNLDWDSHNWYAAQNRGPDGKFFFIPWDGEFVFINSSDNVLRVREAAPGQLFSQLTTNDEFVMSLADRIQELMFNDGLLTPQSVVERWEALSSQMDVAIIGESARWGDYRRDVDRQGIAGPFELLERDVQWVAERNRLLNDYFPVRTDIVVEQYRRANLFPDTPAPLFKLRGGYLSSQDAVELTAPAGKIYYTTDGSDPRLPGGDLSPTAIEYAAPFKLDSSAMVRARVLNEGEWSAIDAARFLVDVLSADASNLRVSEINYNPGDPSAAEAAAGFTDNDDFEFIEIMNISGSQVDLSNVRFVQTGTPDSLQGVDFAFPAGSLIDAGQRFVIVEDPAAFAARYGDLPVVAGKWIGKLSNGDEQITLMVGDTIIQQFTYSDDWHGSTDGRGFTLEAIDPAADDLGLWGKAVGWKASTKFGGTPGSGEVVVGDSNHDGIFNSADFVTVFLAGEYEDGIPNNSTFEEGDWNGDGDFTSADFVFVFLEGNYEVAARKSLVKYDSLFSETEKLGKSKRELRTRVVDELFATDAFVS